MMLSIQSAARLNLSLLDRHVYMSDLVYVDGPVLSLYRDSKENWLYLWCDTDNKTKERWLLFPVSRQSLISYLEGNMPLRTLVQQAKKKWFLDYSQIVPEVEKSKTVDAIKSFSRLLREAHNSALIAEYLPSEDSYFDEELAPNISITRELSPTLYNVPIDGNWFIKDLDNFSNVYSQLYAFFYCTKPQFITDIGNKVQRLLEAPWKGGFSRVNLFEALQRNVPAVHDLKIHQMRYASPGDITIEALESVGESVREVVLRFRSRRSDIEYAVKSLNIVLGDKSLKRVDLSAYGNEKLPLTREDREYIAEKIEVVVSALGIFSEFADLSKRSPNIVVSAKVLLSVVSRVQRLADFEESGLLDLTRRN